MPEKQKDSNLETPSEKTSEAGLKIERYKSVIDRQKYFTDLARDSFKSYLQIYTALITGGITLVYAKPNLDIEQDLLGSLSTALVFLIAFLGVVSIGQIIFCLVRWKGFRDTEVDIIPNPPIKPWWWVFEGLYCLAIIISIIAFACLTEKIEKHLTESTKQESKINQEQHILTKSGFVN